jgi:hypothetical protein
MRITVLLMVLALLCGTAVAQDVKIPEEKEWGYDLAGMRNVPEVEPNDTCPGQIIVCGDVVDGNLSSGTDLDWYQFEITVPNTVVTIGTDAGPAPAVGDTKLYLFGACGTAYLRYDDDSGPGYYSLISSYTIATPGWYNIEVIPYSASYSGNYILFLTCSIPQPPPVNDTCAGAIAIERCTTGLIEGDLTWALNDYSLVSPGSCTGFPTAGRDVAYVMDLLVGDVVHLFYAGGYDEAIYIVTDCANVQGTCLVGRDATVGTGETIDWVAPATGTYFVIADAYGTLTGNDFTIDYSITCPPVAVCCVGEVCYLYNEVDCGLAGGIWHADMTVCDPNPCEIPVPADPNSWGSIKSVYR